MPASNSSTSTQHFIADKALGCDHIEIEDPYYCRDFMSEYSFLYARVLEDISCWAIRLHFWRSREDGGTREYLGFSILRPLRRQLPGPAGYTLARVGRTVLAYDQPNHYIRCAAQYVVHVDGQEWVVRGAPFMQQDSQVMCCAHAAMWVANRILSRTQPTIRDFYPHELATMSTERLTRGPTLPTVGLYVDQMLCCIQQMGFEPLYYDYGVEPADPTAFADGVLYRYVESGIPVILVLPHHAVCVVGHSFDPSARSEPGATDYLTPTTWIRHFIVQDDASGPYCLLPNRDEDIGKEPLGEMKRSLQCSVQAIIVPLPHNILVTGEAAERRAFDSLYDDPDVRLAFEEACRSEVSGEIGLAAAYAQKNLVLRTYLEESNNFKARMRNLATQREGGLRDLAERYASSFMSRYVWVTEISTPTLYASADENARAMVGEIIADTTSSEHGKPEFAVHVPGTLFLNDPRFPYRVHRFAVPDDRPYPHNVLPRA